MAAYEDKSRFTLQGYTRVTHKGKQLKDISSSPRYNSFIQNLPSIGGRLAKVTIDFEGRPDLISYKAYGTTAYWWLILLANNILDIDEDLVVGKIIKIPDIS
jgi:hypothetical protein